MKIWALTLDCFMPGINSIKRLVSDQMISFLLGLEMRDHWGCEVHSGERMLRMRVKSFWKVSIIPRFNPHQIGMTLTACITMSLSAACLDFCFSADKVHGIATELSNSTGREKSVMPLTLAEGRCLTHGGSLTHHQPDKPPNACSSLIVRHALN